MPNRLAAAMSPYLLQHKDNPVDWYPWGEEAFDRARREGKPVFLSVGYSSCHWCHVMEHESFEDQATAGLLNRYFVSVKVDREERPDVDEAYMTAVQLSSGRGGWPMSVFMTPDRKPFFAGTYFPREDRAGHPGFKSVLQQIAAAWATRRGEIEATAEEFGEAIRASLTQAVPGASGVATEGSYGDVVRLAAAEFDSRHGGSQGAPKFPPHTNIEYLMEFAVRPSMSADLREAALAMAFLTLERMCLGGIHDQVGGGFHRYSTDEKWLLPHFEKMLYDNALMLGNLARAGAIAHHVEPRLERLFSRAARGIRDWLSREMTSPEGLFYSALDADSEGEEGKFYVWRYEEVQALLGERSQRFAEAFQLRKEGNFEDEATRRPTGANIPWLQADPGDEFDTDLKLLRDARQKRPRPALDDKAIVAWNGLAIRALAEAGEVASAGRAAAELLRQAKAYGRLPHQIARGQASGEGFLDDYAYVAHALFYLAELDACTQAESEYNWRAEAEKLTQAMISLFYDQERGGFFYTSGKHEELFGRSKPAFDHPTPSANAIAIRCLVAVGDKVRARKSLEALSGWMRRAPQATEALYTSALELGEAQIEEPALVAAKPTAAPEVCIKLASQELRAGPDGWAEGSVLIEVPVGLHLNSNEPPARWLVPTRLEIEPLASKVRYPAPRDHKYEGHVEIPFAVQLPQNERGANMEVRVSFQACTESECLLPQEKVLAGVVVR